VYWPLSWAAAGPATISEEKTRVESNLKKPMNRCGNRGRIVSSVRRLAESGQTLAAIGAFCPDDLNNRFTKYGVFMAPSTIANFAQF
jgi:hypothetical protein